MLSGGFRISRCGGHRPVVGGTYLRRGRFSAETFAKTKELGPLDPPMNGCDAALDRSSLIGLLESIQYLEIYRPTILLCNMNISDRNPQTSYQPLILAFTRAAPDSPTYKWRANVIDDTTSLYNAQRDHTN